LPNVKDEPRPRLARAVLLGARIVTAVVVGSGALLDERRGSRTAENQSAGEGWRTGKPPGQASKPATIETGQGASKASKLPPSNAREGNPESASLVLRTALEAEPGREDLKT
jgi:hypothetical protein